MQAYDHVLSLGIAADSLICRPCRDYGIVSHSQNLNFAVPQKWATEAYHVKKVRCFFLLCTILFCTDSHCSMPMHTLLTDLVESPGSSSVLVKVLSRLGVCLVQTHFPILYSTSKPHPIQALAN